MDYIKKHRKIILCAISIIVFVIILRRVLIEEITFYDIDAYNILVGTLRSDVLTVIMKFFTFLCSVEVLSIICITTFIFSKDKMKASLISINLLINFLLNNLVKIIIRRPRPMGYRLIEESGFSFPSGHSMVSMAFYGYLMYLIYKNDKVIWRRNLLLILLGTIIICIGISRVYLGVHYASDVLAGFFLSIAYLMLFIIFFPRIMDYIEEGRKNGKKEKKKTK